MRYVAGCMSGTSLDGIDAALLSIDGHGLKMTVTLLATASEDFDPQLAKGLRELAERTFMDGMAIQALNNLFSHACANLVQRCGDHQPDLLSVHGQTVLHMPALSWQMINPAIIAEACHCTVVSDLRAADLAAGGQGAPITPIADLILYGNDGERRSIINLGGFCNITWLPADGNPDLIQGFDVCACNHVLDHIARSCFDCAYDKDGELAAQGKIDPDCVSALLQALQSQRQQQRSLGTGNELFTLVDEWSTIIDKHDLAASACTALAQCMVAACSDTDLLICAGGGVKNKTLMQALNKEKNCSISDDFGIPAQYREAAAMAVLGALCQDKIPITLPQVTGANHKVISGNWTYWSNDL